MADEARTWKITIWSERTRAYHTFYSWGEALEEFLVAELLAGAITIEAQIEVVE